MIYLIIILKTYLIIILKTIFLVAIILIAVLLAAFLSFKRIEKNQNNLSVSATEAERLVKTGDSPFIFLQYWDPEIDDYVKITSDDVMSLYAARTQLAQKYMWKRIPYLYTIINNKNVVVFSDIKNIPV